MNPNTKLSGKRKKQALVGMQNAEAATPLTSEVIAQDEGGSCLWFKVA